MTPLWSVPLLLLLLVGFGDADRHYMFTAPKAYNAGETEKMCLTLFNTAETGDLTVTLEDGNDRQIGRHSQTISGVADGSQQACFDIPIPAEPQRHATLKLAVTFPPEANYSISAERSVQIENRGSAVNEEYLFVQTDKYVYKPGQLVRLRVFSVDSDLRPITRPIPLIFVETPLGTRVAQWTEQQGQGGLVQLELQLSDEPTLGEWSIHVQTKSGQPQKKVFRVDEYVLPKFEVDIRGPPYVLADTEEVVFEVCAKYTYDKPVQGNATLKISRSRSTPSGYPWIYYGPRFPLPTETQHQHTGASNCAEFRVDLSRLLGDREDGHGTGLEIRADLTEQGTDVTLGATKVFPVEYSRLKLSTEDRHNKYFKPGLPFVDRIKVRHPDDRPADGQLVQLCITIDRASDDRVCQNLTSDSDGIVTFYVPPQDQIVQTIGVEATLPADPASKSSVLKSDELSYRARGWHSRSGVFLQLSSMADGSPFRCGTTAQIPVLFTGRPGEQMELFYQVMSRGDIQPAVPVAVTFAKAADLSSTELSGIPAVGPPSDQATHAGSVRLSVPVTFHMSPGFTLLLYTVLHGEVMADSRRYEVTPCLQNPVRLTWSADRAHPSQQVQLTARAEPGSICGLDVVDKSVHLLGDKNRIALTDFFDRVKSLSLDTGSGYRQVNDNEYCTAKHGQPKSGLKPPSREYEFAEPRGPARLPGPPGSVGPPGPPRSPPGLSRAADDNRVKRSFMPWGFHSVWTATHVDSLTAFDDGGWLALSDAALETRPCREWGSPDHWDCGDHQPCPLMRSGGPFDLEAMASGPIGDIAYATDDAGLASPVGPPGAPSSIQPAAPSPVPDAVRTYFPETWLFELHTVGEDGTVTLSQQVPDTVTEWVGGAVCTSDSAGLGIAPPASLTTFQPFFVSYTLPYSVKRGETLLLRVSVRNYNEHDLPIKLTLVSSDQFDTLTPAAVTSCLPAGGSEVVPYRLRPSALGDVNITAVAEVFSDYPAVCGPPTVLHFSDAVTRPILVEPEGFPREAVNSSFICNTPEHRDLDGAGADLDVTWPLELPADLVPGSERAIVTVVGDLMGPSLDNLESLVRLPTGCGEQNMVLFAPNIHVMKYLSATGELTEPVKHKLVKHMKSGYQRELTYQHGDKSYSAFGGSDASGSMWLTAFVVKSFGDASKFIFIDETDLAASVKWIESKQTEDGCFPGIGTVFNKAMKGGVSYGGRRTLTAYITIALLRSGVQLRHSTLSDAFSCLRQISAPDVYTLTLRTYAQALAGRTKDARIGLARLKQRAIISDGHMYWQNSESEQDRALSVEMGAYNILTMDVLRSAGYSQYFSDALSVVRWINAQRNSRGGFVSTQDTVLALEALAAFSASLPRSSQANLRVHLSDGHQLSDVIRVTRANRLLVQSRDVTRMPGEVRVRTEGSGCALVQTILKYNVLSASPSEALSISVKSRPKPDQKRCLKHMTEICVSYQRSGKTNMAVVEVEMVSGFIPHKGSLKALKSDVKLDLKRWEVGNNKVVFYFESLDSEKRCFEVLMQQQQVVEDARPASATVYDYYQAEVALSTSYTHDLDCRRMPESLPGIIGRASDPVQLAAGSSLPSPAGPGSQGSGSAPAPSPLQPAPQGRGPSADTTPSKPDQLDEQYSDTACPVCLGSLRKSDFQHYLCEEGGVRIARLKKAGQLKFSASWRPNGKRTRLGIQQSIVMPESCDCALNPGRRLYVFGVKEHQLKRSLLMLTDEHVLAAAPASAQLRRRQFRLARKLGCQ